MKLLAILAAVLTIGNAFSIGQNVMGQRDMSGLGMMGGQDMMRYQRTMALLGMPMEMQGNNLQDMMKEQRGQDMFDGKRMGCKGLCSTPQMNQKQMSYDMTPKEQVQMYQLLNNMDYGFQPAESMVNLEQEKTIAYQMAKQMILLAQQEELEQVQQSVQQMQQQYQNMMTTGSMIQKMAQQQAVQEMQQDMMKQQEIMSEQQTNPTNQMQQFLQVAIEAQMALQNIQMQQSVQNPMMAMEMEQKVDNFQQQMKQFMKENNIEQTKALIVFHEYKVQKTQMQQQFLSQRVHQLQDKLDMLQKMNIQPQVIQQLQVVQQQMQQLQQQLMVKLMAHQMVIYQFQQMLLNQRSQLQQQMASQQTVEYLTRKTNPIMMMMMMPMKMSNMMQA